MKNIINIFKDTFLLARFIANYFYSLSIPAVQFYLINAVGQRTIAINSISVSISGILFPLLWKKYREKIYNRFGIFLLIESICSITTWFLLIADNMNLFMYYVADTLIFSLVTRNIMCGMNMIKTKRYPTEESRNDYDNNVQIVTEISSLIGFVISALCEFDFKIAFTFSMFGYVIDNSFLYNVWKKTNKREQ